MVRGGVCVGEKARGQLGEPEVFVPVGLREVDRGLRPARRVERHAHGARGGVDAVSALLEIAAGRLVAFVHPGGEAIDRRGGIGGLHRGDRLRALARREVSLEEGVVAHAAFRLVRKHGGGDSGQPLEVCAVAAAGVLLP